MGRVVTLVAVLLLVAVAVFPVSAVAVTVAEIDQIRDGELISVGFELAKGAEIDISAVGLRQPQSRKMAVYAWIIDHDTRDLVWSMTLGSSNRSGTKRFLREVEKSKFFEAGKYELYMHAIDQWHYGRVIDGIKDFYDIMADIVNSDDDNWDDWDGRDWKKYRRACFVRVTSDELAVGDIKEFRVSGKHPDALIQFTALGDNEYVYQGFKVDQAMNIRVYALVEHPRYNKTAVDYGWIVNTDTHEKVWEIDRWNTERAGGGRKNRKFDDEIRLDPGTYSLYFVTDDSHSYQQFNMEPPWDPIYWGVSLFPGTDFKASAFHLVDISEERGKPLIDFTRARNNDYHERAFELKKAANLRVYAIGEYWKSDKAFVDYGWIENAITGDVVWEMKRRNTEHAGGGEKNRMFNGTIKLEPGRYVAYYVTDDSHAYRDWNTGRPYDDKAYGLAIYPGESFDNDDLVILREGDLLDGTSILARINRVRDHELRHETFTLDKKTEVKIYAVGEGQDRRMYDYGWIENDKTGHVVWEMTWRRTEDAGGADKNREVTDVITLDPGTYQVYYESDGSHSFGDWNAAAPRHPRDWGITVTRTDGN